MFLPLTVALLVTTCVLALLALVATVRGRPIDNPMFYLTIAIEVLLVIQLIVGIATSGSADPHMNVGVFIAYLVGLIFVLPVALLAVCFLFYVRTVPDHPAAFAENPEPLSQVFRQLLFDPREHRDFTLVWIGRFLLQTGLTFFSTYQLYFLLDRLNLSPQDAGQKLALVGGIGIAVTTGFAVMGGVLSDRWQRRKVFIYFASALAAAGLTVMAFAPNVIAYSAATLLILAAAGLFGSVDLAMAGDVVPDKSAAGRWMSILNVAGYIPSAIAPVLAPLILAIGSAPNYTALYLTGALIATGAGFTAWRIRAVR